MGNMIYMDNAATTPTEPEVVKAMLPYFTMNFGNASTIYDLGQKSRMAIAAAREQVAKVIDADPGEIFFTGGGTEADNWVLEGAVDSYGKPGKEPAAHIITDRIEHHAILNTCRYLESKGVRVTYLDVDEYGRIRPEDVAAAIDEDTVLVSVMTSNNEIGTIEPIEEIGRVCHEHGVLFHTDAVQAFGHIPLDVHRMNIDYLSVSAHKLGGPKGVGCLFMRKGKSLKPFEHGGEQEQGRRAGTENTPAIVGFGKAASLSMERMEEDARKMIPVRDHLIDRLVHEIPGCSLNGDPVHRLPGNVHVCIPGIEGETLVMRLNRYGIAAGAGSACSSGSLEPSHVLKAIGKSHTEAFEGLRLTISAKTTMKDADYVVDCIRKCM